MKKSEQLAINEQVLNALTEFNSDSVSLCTDHWRQLRKCSASVAPAVDKETGEVMYYVLCSYCTIVAVIDTRTGILYDFLRYVYGFTSTTAPHIAKFSCDYACTKHLTYREV